MKLPLSNFRFQIGSTRHGANGPICNWQSAAGNPVAFTLVEIIIVVALLSFIILGLMAMFGQTQRAFRLGMTQNDVLESGRLTSDLIFRELEQVTPSYLPAMGLLPNNSFIRPIQPNFYASLLPFPPLVQPLPGSSSPRTNLLEDLFFLIRQNQEWIGIGYFVRTNNPVTGALGWPLVGGPTATAGAGTLYRFQTNAPPLSGRTPAQMYAEFSAATFNESRASKIMDGVLHFRVRAYNTNGFCIVSNSNVSASGTQTNTAILLSDYSNLNVAPGEVSQYIFYSNAVPASVELEIGVLEDRAWERYQSLDPASQYRYLVNQAGSVHLFRQRVAIRSVDPLAYR